MNSRRTSVAEEEEEEIIFISYVGNFLYLINYNYFILPIRVV